MGLGEILSGHREAPDGSLVQWQVTSPFVFPRDGLVPFLIAWGDTPHPAGTLLRAGTLVGLSVEHPDVSGVRTDFEQLGVEISVAEGPSPRIIAQIERQAAWSSWAEGNKETRTECGLLTSIIPQLAGLPASPKCLILFSCG